MKLLLLRVVNIRQFWCLLDHEALSGPCSICVDNMMYAYPAEAPINLEIHAVCRLICPGCRVL